MMSRLLKFTNRKFVLDDHEQKLQPMLEMSAFMNNMDAMHIVMHSTFTYDIRTNSSSFWKSIHPNDRIGIDFLSQNVDEVMIGKFFLCRCITPAFKMTSIMTVVDDPEGVHAVRLALYNYSNQPQSMLNKVLPVGLMLAIKNPWFKTTMDGALSIRCDNPRDVVTITEKMFQALFPNLEWKGQIPAKYARLAIAPSPVVETMETKILKLKNLGNKSFAEKQYFDAIQFYADALELDPTNTDILSNRCASMINVGCYKLALGDAISVLEQDPAHVKCIFRYVNCLLGLTKWGEAEQFITAKLDHIKHLKEEQALNDLPEKIADFRKQNETGKFEMVSIIKTAARNIIDIAEYTGPVEIRDVEGKGRGLVVTKDVQGGELLICSKAFAHFRPDNDGAKPKNEIHFCINLQNQSANSAGHVAVARMIEKKLALDAELGTSVYRLFAGSKLGYKTEDDAMPVMVEPNRIERIVALNCFSDKTESDANIFGTGSTGLWLLPSYINHSCVNANAYWQIYGDMMFVRAVKPILKNEEILIAYIPPTESFQRRSDVFTSHDFTCGCELCKCQGEEDPLVRKQRKRLMQQVKSGAKNLAGAQINRCVARIAKLEMLQEKHSKWNLWLCDSTILQIAEKLFELEEFEKCATILKKIHFVATDSALCLIAAQTSMNILGAYLFLMRRSGDQSLVRKWIGIVKQDLNVAFGSLQPITFLGASTLAILKVNAMDFFED